MHLASTLTGTRLVAAAVVFAAGFGLYRAWPDAPPDPERVSTATTYTYVPLMGDPTRAIEDAQDQQGAGCAPFVAPLIAHPNWSLRIDLDASGHLVVHRGKHEVITPAERVELFDFVATRIGAVHGKAEDYPVLRGSLVTAGVRLPISLHQWEDQQLSVLWQALADASELESRR